jgi:hypothetical protein
MVDRHMADAAHYEKIVFAVIRTITRSPTSIYMVDIKLPVPPTDRFSLSHPAELTRSTGIGNYLLTITTKTVSFTGAIFLDSPSIPVVPLKDAAIATLA